MANTLSFDETYLISIWLEILFYGIYLGLFSSSSYIILRKKGYRTASSRVMFYTMVLMFVLATIHIGVNFFRLLKGYVWLRNAPGGPAAYLNDLSRWDQIMKDTIYATQSIIGDALAVFRCWIVWDKNYYIVTLPLVLLVCSTFSGYIVAWIFTTISNASIFSPRLNSWIITFHSIAFAQNVITTSLMAYQMWRQDRAARVHARRYNLIPMARIIIESAAIYVFAEFILIVLYVTKNPAQFIVLETLTPLVGIVFASITVRVTLRNRIAQGTAITIGMGSALREDK